VVFFAAARLHALDPRLAIRALQPLLACPCPLDCSWCKVQFAYSSGFT